jgi:uracil-DNA glycosylase
MVVIVGDRPSEKNTDPTIAFVGTTSYDRLLRIMNAAELVAITLVNAFDMDGNVQDIPKAMKYVALGNNASDRLTELGIEHLKLPHPSGRNRYWNDEGAEELAAQKLKEYVYGQK